MKTYRVNILGCRSRGTAAAQAYHAHPRTEVVGLCDLVKDRLNALGDALNVSARFTDLDEMIQQTEPDIVAIPTGTEYHYDLCMRVLEHGVHIEVEKPMCVDLVQADAVIAKAEEKGVRVAVHHQGRVGAAMRAAESAFKAGKIGQLRYIYGSGKGYYAGLGLMNIGTHMVNNMLKFGGHCRSVMAQAATNGKPITPEDVAPSPLGMGTIACEYITAALQFGGNVTGTLLQHRFDRMDTSAYAMELYGTEGRLFWKNSGAWLLPQPHFVPDGTHDRWEALPLVYPEHYDPAKGADAEDYLFVDEYVRALDEGREHECNGFEGRHVLEILMGIFESAAYGTRVSLPQENREHPLVRWRREAGLEPPVPMPRGYGDWLDAEFRRLGR
jgi:predicted dehydrogenase